MSVTEEYIHLNRDGVIGPFPGFVDDQHLVEVRSFVEHVIRDQPSHPLYGTYSVRDWHLAFEPLLRLLTAPILVDAIQRATGADDLILWRTKIFEKFPGEGPIDWHQEYGYFDGEEAGGHRPALFPLGPDSPWNWTVWLPLTDVGERGGVMEFVPGSHLRRYPTEMVPLTRSGAFIEPRHRVTTKEELITRAEANSLIVDVNTRNAFSGVNTDLYSFSELFAVLLKYCDRTLAAVTEPFDTSRVATRVFPMKAGDFLIFSERCMHRSRGAESSAPLRLAINARYTLGSTWVYPQRAHGDSLDGSHIDVAQHKSVKVVGSSFTPLNDYL
jgi:non-haem Fe2+, alpha-ketoglutarate-dependent halogenase